MKKLSDESIILKQFKMLIKSNFIFVFALIMYISLAFLFFRYYQYGFFPDSISYIGIAQKYVIGDYSNAINGCWGPLLSWLLTPFLFFGSTKMYMIHSAKILSLIIGFFTLFGIKFLFSKFIMDEKIRNIVIFAMVPLVFYFAISLFSPDLLILCFLLFYLGLIFDPKYSLRLRNGIACGLLGVLAYFSKSYAFIFFLCHFLIFNLFFYFHEVDNEKKRNIKKNLILGLTVFLAISGIWIGLISDKYGEITIGTAGTFNLAIIGPESEGLPPFYQGLIVPPNKSAGSAWEDPSYIKIKPWNPLGTMKSFIFEMNNIWNNILETGIILLSFSVFSFLIILASLIFVIKYKKDEVSRINFLYLLITIFIYLGGYCLIRLEARYLWIISILIFLMGVYLSEVLYIDGYLKSKIRNMLLVLLIISFIIIPISLLIISINTDANFHDLSYTLKYEYNIHGNIASNDEYVISQDLSYYLDGRYYGQTKKGIGLNELKNELKGNNIDYYFVWGEYNQTDLPYNEITNGKIPYLKIYSIKNSI